MRKINIITVLSLIFFYGLILNSANANEMQIATGFTHIVGLKTNGTVIIADPGNFLQYNISNWSDIKQIAAGYTHIRHFLQFCEVVNNEYFVYNSLG